MLGSGRPKSSCIERVTYRLCKYQFCVCVCAAGTFKVQTKAVGRRVRCFYNVTEPGQYMVDVTWSGDPVPHSPFNVLVFASEEELDSYAAATSLASTSDGSSSTVSRTSSCSVQ